jgi:peroxiredoxin Q/BCP
MAGKARSKSKSVSPAHPASTLLNKPAPDFELPDGSGNAVSLQDLLSKGNVVLYFYPRDFTAGCSKEACDFRDRQKLIGARGATIVGISTDSAASHEKFAAKYALDFPLLSDVGAKVARRYGVYKRKKLYGREFEGIERTTFIIDRRGLVRRIFPRVKVEGHVDAVLMALEELA